MTPSMLHLEFAHATHSELLRRADRERLVHATRTGRGSGRLTPRVWWRLSGRIRSRQLPQVVRPLAAL